jgi:hypothetical protein
MAAVGYISGFLVSYPKRTCQGCKPFFIQFDFAAIFEPHAQSRRKKNAPKRNHPKAFSLRIVGNLAVLARSALDPWFCVAIFR